MFLSEIDKTPFVGNWTSKSKIFNFNKREGIVEMQFYHRIRYTSDFKNVVYVLLRIRDGIYLDNWVDVLTEGVINFEDEFNFKEKSLIFKNFNCSIRYGHDLDYNNNFESKLNFNLKDGFTGNFMMSWTNDKKFTRKITNVTAFIDVKNLISINFPMKLEDNSVSIYKTTLPSLFFYLCFYT